MKWAIVLLIVLIALIVIIAAYVIPKFRKVLFIIIGIAAIICLIGFFAIQYEKSLSKKRISPNEIDLTDLKLAGDDFNEDTQRRRLLGRIKNNSTKYILSRLKLKLIMRDCIKPDDCEITGEAYGSFYTNIPPGQIREINEGIYFSNLAVPKNKGSWDYEILEIIGK